MADNLLDKASILLTPTAYNDGRMLSVKPNENLYGSELVTNGDFSQGSQDWTFNTNGNNQWSVANEKASYLGTATDFIITNNVLTIGKKYLVSFDILDTNGSTIRLSVNSEAGGSFDNYTNGDGKYTTYLTANTNYLRIGASSSGASFSIDNVSVKEDLTGDFTFSRSSAATRVNAQGLVENVQIISSELVSNGNFSQIGTEEVSNGNFSQEGSELVTNGDFATDSDWNKGLGITISSGSANFTSVSSGFQLSQSGTEGVVGKTYKITYEIKSISQGAFSASIGTTLSNNQNNQVGVYTEYLTATGTGIFYIRSRGTTTGSIDNVSVKEVGQDWSLGTGWSIGEDKAVLTNVGYNINCTQANVTTIGQYYKVEFTILDYLSGQIRLSLGGNATPMASADGTYSFYIQATANNLVVLQPLDASGTNLSITNISVKEVGQDWTLGTGWSVDQANSKVVGDGTSFTYITQSPISIQNKKVKLTFDISDYVSGTFRLLPSDRQDGLDERFSGNGSYEVVYISTLDTFRFQQQAFNGSISNISVKEITDDTDLPRINYEGFSYQDSLGSELIVNGDFATDTNWTKASNWTISGGSANADGSSGGQLSQTTSSVVVGKTYKIQYTILNYVSGSFRFSYAGTSESFNTSNGTYTTYRVATSTANALASSSISFIGSIDNVSVKEYLGQEVVPDSGCGSWLLEPQSTNLIPYSEDFSNITDYALTVTDNSTISPENINNGTSLVPSTVNTVHYLTFPNTSTGTVTFTVYAKANGYNYIFLHLYDGSNGRAWFNLDTGVVGTKDSSVTSEMIAMTNGWYRCSVTRVLSGSLIQADIAVSNADNATTFSGNGTSGIFIYGAQLEEQSYATSYIPTNGATNTRLQDIANNSGNSTLINSTEGVLYAEIAALADDGTNRTIALNKDTNDRIQMYFDASTNGLSIFYKAQSGATAFVMNQTLTDTTLFNKIAFKWKTNDFSLWINGTKTDTVSSGVTSNADTLNSLDFKMFNNSNTFYGKAKTVAVYKEALTNAELQSLTTI